MRILAIDPGTRKVGVSVWEGKELKHSDGVRLKGVDLGARLWCLYTTIESLTTTWDVDVVVCEAGFVGPNRKTSMTLAMSRGIIAMVCRGGKYEELTPTHIKMAWTGNGRASKQDMRKELYNKGLATADHIYTEDEIDAIAIGYTYAIKALSADMRAGVGKGPAKARKQKNTSASGAVRRRKKPADGSKG